MFNFTQDDLTKRKNLKDVKISPLTLARLTAEARKKVQDPATGVKKKTREDGRSKGLEYDVLKCVMLYTHV